MPRMRIAAAGAVLTWLAVLSCYDIRQHRLPNALTLTGAPPGWPGALAAIYLLVHAVAPGGMGAGDVKLALGVGALTGCGGVGVWFLAAPGEPGGLELCLAAAAGAGLALF